MTSAQSCFKLPRMPQYEPEAWREPAAADPTAREQCRLLDLLGRINYRILSGNRVYVEVEGVVYKTVYGGYWRSVFTGIEHYLLHCEQVSSAVWILNLRGPFSPACSRMFEKNCDARMTSMLAPSFVWICVPVISVMFRPFAADVSVDSSK